MRKLIRKILKEQEEEEFVFPSYENPDEPKFKYLDNKLKGLIKKEPLNYYGVIFGFPDKEYGVLGWRRDGILYIYHKLVDDISNVFGLNRFDSESLIGKWVSDRYKLEVKNNFLSNSTEELS